MAGEIPTWRAMLSAANNGPISASRVGTGLLTSPACTVVPVGGSGTWTYSWSQVSGATFNISSTTAATVTWSDTRTAPTGVLTAVWRCTVRDNQGTPLVTTDVNLDMEWA